jgi:tetratricopeptide (TPR) repeat protein
VSKKHKHKPGPIGDPRVRINRAVRDGRFQIALDLTRQLYKSEPTPEHRQLLHTTGMGRARQLRHELRTRDAVAVLHALLQAPDNKPAWLSDIAAELAACGEVKESLAMLGANADPAVVEQFLAQAADTAIQKEAAGRALLPESLQADFDRILTAFHQLEAGQDGMRETLQPIGLRSPFLEWKVFLRGLEAYYQNDDTRALENWQRLKSDRLPARLAAPMRFNIDRPYQAAQPPETQTILRRQIDALQSSDAHRLLGELRPALAGIRNMAPVFRTADQAKQALQREAPHLIPRLATVLYWATLTQGQPEDVPRYQRVFGNPADDKNFHRMHALAWERTHVLDEAHMHWQAYEKEIAGHPESWPGETGTRARAIIWQHMGELAASIPDAEQVKKLPPFLRNHPDRPKPLKPTAEECFRASIALAPDEAETYLLLFHHLKERKNKSKAIKVGRDLLKRKPDHFEMLTQLGALLLNEKQTAEAVELFEQALKTNPLDRQLRNRVSNAHMFHARSLAEKGQYDEARREYQTSLDHDSSHRASLLCKWAACEFKAGDDARAEQLLMEAKGITGSELGTNYSMVIEAIRLKLAPAIKKRFEKAFTEGLKTPADPLSATHLADTAAVHVAAGIEYLGQKTHEKKVLTYLRNAQKLPFTEEQLESVCRSLMILGAYRLTTTLTREGQKRFKDNPEFWLVEAENEIGRGEGMYHPYTPRRLLENAQTRAEKMPHGPKRDKLLERIHGLLKLVEVSSPFGSLFSGFGPDFDPFGPFEDDEDDDEWY